MLTLDNRRIGKYVYAEFRYTSPVTHKQDEISLGRVPTPDEVEAETEDKYGRNAPAGMVVVTIHAEGYALDPIRKKARKYRRKVRTGHDPRHEMGPEGFTLQTGLELLVKKATKARRSERTIKEYEDNMRRYFKKWLDVPLRRFNGQVGRTFIRKHHEKIAKRAPAAADAAMRTFRTIWNTARKEDASLDESPTIAVHWHKPERRTPAIALGAPLEQWFADLAAMKNEAKRDWFLIAVLTGLRRKSLFTVRRADIDLETRTLHVPKPKGGEPFDIPLTDTAVTVINRRLGASTSPWLFPAKSKSGHVEEVRPEPSDGLTVKFSPHDLRRVYISAATAAGVHPVHAHLLAHHKLPRADAHNVYIKLGPEDLRTSQQQITDYLLTHGLTV